MEDMKGQQDHVGGLSRVRRRRQWGVESESSEGVQQRRTRRKVDAPGEWWRAAFGLSEFIEGGRRPGIPRQRLPKEYSYNPVTVALNGPGSY